MKILLTKIIITGIITLQIVTNVSSQENTVNPIPDKHLTFGAGYSQLMLLDKQVSPLIYKAHFFPVSLEYTKKTYNGMMNFKFKLANGFTGPKHFKERDRLIIYTDNNGVFQEYIYTMKNNYIVLNEINFEYVWKINSLTNDKTSFYVGGQTKQFFLFSFTDVPLFVHNELSINPSFVATYELMGLKCLSRISFFAVGAITKLPYSNNPVDGEHNYFVSTFRMGTEFSTIKDYQRINLHQSIMKTINNKWAIGLNYNFYWYSCPRYNNSKAYNNSFSLIFTRKLQSNEK